MPVGPIMMGIATIPSGLGPQNNDTSNLFGFAKLFEPITTFPKNAKESSDANALDQFAINGTTKFPIRGHEPVPFAWYLSVFTGLIMFLLVISIAEIFCKREDILDDDYIVKEENLLPPPPYEEFAPPSYDSLQPDDSAKKRKLIEVFVLPMNTDATENDGSGASASNGNNNAETTDPANPLPMSEF